MELKYYHSIHEGERDEHLVRVLQERSDKEERMMINIDMDGVVADFDQAIINIFGRSYDNDLADEFWKQICVEQKVFEQMPPIPQGINMVNDLIAAGIPICFMTSTGGMPHHIDIARQKLTWLEWQGLGTQPIAFSMNTAGKAAYARPGAILIDDRQKVCDAWTAAGGCSILFTPMTATSITDFIKDQYYDEN